MRKHKNSSRPETRKNLAFGEDTRLETKSAVEGHPKKRWSGIETEAEVE